MPINIRYIAAVIAASEPARNGRSVRKLPSVWPHRMSRIDMRYKTMMLSVSFRLAGGCDVASVWVVSSN